MKVRGCVTLCVVVLLGLSCTDSRRAPSEKSPAADRSDSVVAASKEEPSPPRLVLLYATCTVNPRFLSPYNPDVTYTPALEAFADKSTVFRKHRTEAGLSGVSYASIFTGLQAPGHGVFVHPKKLDDGLYGISEAFADNGYETFSWNDHKMASRRLNYLQGVPEENANRGIVLQNKEDLNNVLERLRDEPDYRAFIVLTFTVTHSPYKRSGTIEFIQNHPEVWTKLYESPPSTSEFDRLVDLYYDNTYEFQYAYEETVDRLELDAIEQRDLARVLELLYQLNINRLDRRFGEVYEMIESAGVLDDSTIVFTADHGETLHRDDSPFHWSHGHTVQAEVLNVPLIVFAPAAGVPARAYNAVSRSIDVFPTMAGLCDLNLPDGIALDGVDLANAVRGDAAPPELLAFSHSSTIPKNLEEATSQRIGPTRAKYYPEPDIALTWVAVRDRDLVVKYGRFDAESFTFRAYDLGDDPLETRDIFDAADGRHSALAEKLLTYRDRLIESYAQASSGSDESSEEDIEALKSLGYIQ